MSKILSVYKKITELRQKYYQLAQNKQALLKMIGEAEIAEQVYNSNAIENSTLTLEETEKILLQIDLDRYINERELFEARNLARVVDYINNKAKDQELNIDIILFMHKTLLSNIRDDVAGRFRKENEWVKVANHIGAAPEIITKKMNDTLMEYQATQNENIIKRISLLHLRFENIHPFVDGNGRLGRAINNYLLIREGFVPINIKFIDRAQYYQAFREFDSTKQTNTMEEIVGKALINSYHKRIAYLEGLEIITLNDYAKKKQLSHSNLINKAHRQTIEAFWEKGIWKIGLK